MAAKLSGEELSTRGTTMKTELKQKWVEALRSTKYTQGTTWLRKKDSAQTYHCCLGVLCEIMDPKCLVDRLDLCKEISNLCKEIPIGVLSHSLNVLDDERLNDAGLTRIEMNKLINLNDTLRRNFNEIADFIEVNL
jgi:hypothetical protein